ncbi:MAG: VIT domain-containing protein [Anaerolineae bacterium]
MSTKNLIRTVLLTLGLLFVLGLLALSPAPAHADGLVVIDNCFNGPLPSPDIEPPVTPPCFWPFGCATPPPQVRPPVPNPNCAAYLAVKNHNVTVTIQDQVARTHVDETFVNPSDYQLEGTYIFPLPDDATINDFAMYVDGQKLEGKVLDSGQARQIYEDIVRRRRDPALLEYVGRNAFQARIFPIPPHSEKRVEISYGQVLKSENGLVRYVYPLSTEKFSTDPIASVTVNVTIQSTQALKAIYSPSHQVGISRKDDYAASVGYEAANVKPDKDFVLYYSVSSNDVGATLLSYKPDDKSDGFFLLLVTPKVKVADDQVIAKDVILVLDTSGSMDGPKIDQARKALKYVLEQLNAGDRFNIITFSTGTVPYATSLQPLSARADAERFVDGIYAGGSTDINRALLETLSEVDRERPTTVIFLTDGLPTVGETNIQRIIDNVDQAARSNVRLFTFGVGDDVNTILLDTLSEKHRGASAYVRPADRIDETVSEFYRKVSTPVLSDVTVDWGGATVSDVYPYPLPDLFAGSQLVIAGRYRAGAPATITLKGDVNGQSQTYKFEDLTFKSAGGDDFIAPLWATRKIGYLLAQIRLHGETPETRGEVVSLATRYGIVTPYTSFLITEPHDSMAPQPGPGGAGSRVPLPPSGTGAGGGPMAMPTMSAAPAATSAPAASSGAGAVTQSQSNRAMQEAEQSKTNSDQVKQVGDKAFVLKNGVWTDTTFDASTTTTTKVAFGSSDYFDLLAQHPDWSAFAALGDKVIFVVNGVAYEITSS